MNLADHCSELSATDGFGDDINGIGPTDPTTIAAVPNIEILGRL